MPDPCGTEQDQIPDGTWLYLYFAEAGPCEECGEDYRWHTVRRDGKHRYPYCDGP